MPKAPRPGKKPASYERILDAAAQAIREVGFAQVSVADIMRRAGLTHGGFYAHFASREALLAKALERADASTTEFLAKEVRSRTAKGVGPFQALVETYLSEHHLASPGTGCPVAALSSEMSLQSGGIREAACDTVHSLVDVIRRALPDDRDAETAVLIAGTMVGAMQLARMLGNNQQGKALLAANRKALLRQYVSGDAAPDRS